eukprot:gb/GEZN01008223.1/.p1 GENE.gb/GEZN01008223.1/~~gb/GEZN01008223.1/.p1  ORF type:complete len:454 (+),score=90.89 gb/GEZN01008223.1/:29-1390(+)
MGEKDEIKVGQQIMLKGTGRYWGGGIYPVTVVEVADNTVKVHYSDGGYKRFPTAEFLDLKHVGAVDPDSYASIMDEIVADPDFLGEMEESFDAVKYQMDVADAVREKDYKKAALIKRNFQARRGAYLQYVQTKGKLKQALLLEDFDQADKLQKELDREKSLLEQGKSIIKTDVQSVLSMAANKAFKGGLAGAGAMIVQVSSLMWIRTIMNYQYKNGGTTKEAFKVLWAEGGIGRLYRGLGPALLQGPLARFGDTAANAGIMAFMDTNETLRNAPPMVKTVFASASAAGFRIFLMPVDTVKTTMQVNGADGIKLLTAKMKTSGPSVLFHGALGASAATFAGHYPWFATYNTLQGVIPMPEDKFTKLGRNAGIGFASSVVSDTFSNSLRVLKTYRQTSDVKVSYMDAAKIIIEKDGLVGLFGRGLKTRILANGMQGMMFSVLWKFFEEKLSPARQ